MAMMMEDQFQQHQQPHPDDPSRQQQQPASILQSTYPSAPMEYVNLFTNENVKSGKVPPPPPVIKDSYMSFGRLIDPNDVLIRSLDSQGIQCLFNLNNKDSSNDEKQLSNVDSKKSINTTNHKRELKKLNHSILIAYLDLLEILVKAPNTLVEEAKKPSKTTEPNVNNNEGALDGNVDDPFSYTRTLREQKLNDIELLFINMHHLINELRPHQARDNIRCILEMQKQQRIETAKKFKMHIFKIVELLKTCINSIQNDTSGKTSVYMNELSILLKNANKLTKSLDKLNNGSLLMESDMNLDDDIEMKPIEETYNTNDNVKIKETNINKNCDIKELVLCDLIDDFLSKENEF